jgi:heat shock protein HslJ
MTGRTRAMIGQLVPLCALLALAAACAPREEPTMAAPAAQAVDLAGTEWLAFDIAGSAPVERTRPSIRFGEDGRVSGAGSCNRFVGGWRRTDDGLRLVFGPMASTMMACAEPVMAQEQRYLRLLEGEKPFTLRPDGTLVIGTPPESVSFRRVTDAAAAG